MECMFTAQRPSVLHAIEVAVVQFAQVQLVLYIAVLLGGGWGPFTPRTPTLESGPAWRRKIKEGEEY